MSVRTIFVSSVQREFAEARRALKDFVTADPLLRRFFDVFLFEDLPARDQSAQSAYLAEVDCCAVFVALLGQSYGSEDAAGTSPTEREFDRATSRGKKRLVFVHGRGDGSRQPKMLALVRRAESQLVRRQFEGVPDLTASLYASLVEYLEAEGLIVSRPFDASTCPGTMLADLSAEKLDRFLGRAEQERQFALSPGTPMGEALAHLNLLDGDRPTRAA